MNTSQKMRNVGKNNFMRKLALSDEILLKISQPARYIGGEVTCNFYYAGKRKRCNRLL